MKTHKKLIVVYSLMIFFFLLSCDLFAQYSNWGAKQEYNFTLKTYNSNSRTFNYDIISDNYGIHFVGLNDNTQNHNLTYYLLDNNGQILEQFINSEYEYYGVSILSSKGNVVIAAVSQSGIVIFKKSNGASTGFVKIGIYSGGNYIFGSSFYMKNMSSVEFNNKIYISWDNSGYNNFPQKGNIGLLQYDANNDEIIFRVPIDHHTFPDTGTGYSPKLTASSTKLHAVYRIQTSEQYIQEPFKSRDMYLNHNNEWTLYDPITLGTWDGDYYYDPQTRANILCVGNKLYAVGHLLYTGSFGLAIDTKFKVRDLTLSTPWQELRTIAIDDNNLYKSPPVIFDQFTNKLVFSYADVQNASFVSYNREFDISTNTLENGYPVFTDNYLIGGTLSNSIHGNYLTFSQAETSGKYDVSRRPRPITGNITYNTLLTGTEFINTSTSTSCHSNGAKIIAENGSITTIAANSHLYIDQGDGLELKSGSILNIQNNAQIIVDGNNTSLKLNPNSMVQLGENAKIEFKNGAYLKADGSNFSGLNGATWEGIVFENAGTANEIKNCTFHNAKTSLKFDNNSYGENSKAEIINNTFNVPAGGITYGVYGNNMFKLNIKDNKFYTQSFSASYTNVGVYLKSSFNPGPPPEDDATPYALTIQYNLFRGGKAGMILANYASQYIPYTIMNNNFNDAENYFSDYGILGRKIDADISNCHFHVSRFNHNLNFTQSNIRVRKSIFTSYLENIYMNNYSSLDIGSTAGNGEDILIGGENTFSSSNNTNIYLAYYQNINLQNGYNCFNLKGENDYHLNGGINIDETELYAERNYWNSGYPVYNLTNKNNNEITLIYNPFYNCNSLSNKLIHQIIDRGNGLIDTIYKVSNGSSLLSPETNLYLQAQQYANSFNYPASILNQKTLITQYPTGMYQPYILNDLYLNYEKLDTSSNQGYRDNLYSDLKNFLNEKINSGLYDYQFNDFAYQLVLMCDGNMQNYNDALTGYEFIAMYHPDAATRLLASWDYVEIDALLNGMGGGNSENLSEEVFTKKVMKRLDKVIRKDSVLTSLKRNYDKLNKERSQETKIDLESKNIDVYEKALFKKENDENIVRKSLVVLMGSKSMSNELKAEKQLEDILLISGTNSHKKVIEGNTSLPGEYILSQNYPNPFNPVTKINYALPKQGFVTLKIYDITGREIQTLVNEVKQEGYYTVDFNGAHLSSGVYFYRIRSGNFVSVKRMVLVK